MDPERWKQVDELLESALAQPFNKRDEFLRRACAGNDEVEREVRSLLQAHNRVGSFQIPRFKLDCHAQLERALRALGMERAFDPCRASSMVSKPSIFRCISIKSCIAPSRR
jgi:hypothetical protein